MNYGQVGAVCPQCGSAAAVHSIGEMAALAKNQLGQQPGYGPTPQQDYGPPAQDYGPSGFDPPPPGGYGEPSQSGYAPPPPPGYQGPPPPGYTGSARPGGSPQGTSASSSDPGAGVEDMIADVVMGAATRFLGGAISRRVQRAVNERVLPNLAARTDAMLRDSVTVAERHPDLRACLTDQVVFLAGGQRVLPMPNLSAGFTVEQADALVARLRDG